MKKPKTLQVNPNELKREINQEVRSALLLLDLARLSSVSLKEQEKITARIGETVVKYFKSKDETKQALQKTHR